MTGTTWRRELRRAVSYHRRLLAAGLAAGAVAAALTALAPPAPPSVPVLVAARDLAGGAALAPGDVRTAELAAGAVPDGALTSPGQVQGRVLAAPARRGELLTDLRLVGPGLLAGYGDGLVASVVRVAEPGTAGLVHAGDLVDVVAADTVVSEGAATVGDARTVARTVRVVAVPAAEQAVGAGEGALLIVATTPETAADLARAAVTARLSVSLRAG